MLRFFVALVFTCAAGTMFGDATTFTRDMNFRAKEHSAFFPAELRAIAAQNIQKYSWARDMADAITSRAATWMERSDDELWKMMFGARITRSWMVWSNGHCPACRKDVPMYMWKIDAMQTPWKVGCPHCNELFPKNDFGRFYASGLDEQGVFDPEKADRSLLFNVAHPSPTDPLHKFGVDDGEGYVEGDKRWRFIGCYLIYGQWKQCIIDGARALAAAYVVTGDVRYAHKAGIILDRVADLYPTFDMKTQGLVYEKGGIDGYVSVWHDACMEIHELALAYDQAFEGMREDSALADFLAAKASAYKLSNPKRTFADIQYNVEDRLLSDTITNRHKIHCNFPWTENTLAILHAVLHWPDNRDAIFAHLAPVMEQATAMDGVTGERGMDGYACLGPQSMSQLIGNFIRVDERFLQDMITRHPKLKDTFRFHIDTWCLAKYYHHQGDAGDYGKPIPRYAGVPFGAGILGRSQTPQAHSLTPSNYTLFHKLYELLGDEAYIQVLYRGNRESTRDLPRDLFVRDPEKVQERVAQVIAAHGVTPRVGSVLKNEWKTAILRSGEGENARAVSIHFGSAGNHAHNDGMDVALFAKGLDLMPDAGYPPVQYGGWDSKRAMYYKHTAAHNTICVDRRNQALARGRMILWADGKRTQALRASCPEMIGGRKFDRTLIMPDVSDKDVYLIDVFRVAGGSEHARFLQSHFGTVTTGGLNLQPGEAQFSDDTVMRNFMNDRAPAPGWWVDWKVQDRYHAAPVGSDVHLRLTDLTNNADASLLEGWINVGGYNENEEVWIPRVMVRRHGQPGLESTFAAVIEPYDGTSRIRSIRRLALHPVRDGSGSDSDVAVELQLASGEWDLVVSMDTTRPLVQKEWAVETDAQVCVVRRSADAQVSYVCMAKGSYARIADLEVHSLSPADMVEIALHKDRADLLTTQTAQGLRVTRKGESLLQ